VKHLSNVCVCMYERERERGVKRERERETERERDQERGVEKRRGAWGCGGGRESKRECVHVQALEPLTLRPGCAPCDHLTNGCVCVYVCV